MLRFGVVNFIFGSPGSGKTTVLSKICRYYVKRKIPVYSNFPCSGAILINDKDLGYYNFNPDREKYNSSVILLDEAGIFYNNRDACNKKGLMQDENRLQFWKLARHYRCQIIVASQSFDVDLKIRNLANNYFYIKRSLIPGFTVVKPIYKVIDIDETTHQPMDMYRFDIFIHFMWVFRRRWYKYFDSYDCPPLPDYPVVDPVP